MEKEQLATVLADSLERQVEWIKMADSKAGVAFGFSMAMLGLLAAVSPKHMSDWVFVAGFFAFPTMILCIVNLVFLALALFPRTWGPSTSLVYCGGIAKLSADEFKKAMLNVSIDTYMSDLSAQCHRNAEIATLKFKWVQRAMFTLYVASIPWGLSIWLLYSGPARAP